MKFKLMINMAVAVAGVSLAFAGTALASDGIDGLDGGSVGARINRTTRVNTNITNTVTVTNTNTQSATSGNVTVRNNGVVGPVSSGNAINTNTVRTVVNIASPKRLVSSTPCCAVPVPVPAPVPVPVPGPGVGGPIGGPGFGGPGFGGPGGGPVAAAPTATSPAASSPTSPAQQAPSQVSPAAAMMPEVLPGAGAKGLVDVSALRAAWHPQNESPATSMIRQTRGASALMIAIAAALSLLGAVGGAVYTWRKDERS